MEVDPSASYAARRMQCVEGWKTQDGYDLIRKIRSHDSVLFTGSTVAASQVISSARGVQQGDPLGLVLFALAIWRPVLPRRPRTRVGLTFAPFSLMMGSVLVLPRRFGTFFLPWFMVCGALGSRLTLTRPRLFLHVPPPSRLLLAIFRVAFRLGSPISNFWGLLWGLRVGVRICWAGAFVMPGPS